MLEIKITLILLDYWFRCFFEHNAKLSLGQQSSIKDCELETKSIIADDPIIHQSDSF